MMIVRIIGIQEISEPTVMPGTGMAMYTISYRAVVWQPFRGEVVDGEVSQVVPNGFFVDVGALGVFVSKAVSYDISLGLAEGFYRWNWTLTGVAMLSQMIPSSMKFSMEGATPSFEDNDGQVITAGGHVRLRIKGIRSELNQMFAIGSIREDYLGYELAPLSERVTPITDSDGCLVLFSTSRCSDIADTKNLLQLHGGQHGDFPLFLVLVTASVPQIWTSARRWRHGAREKAKREKTTSRRGKLCLRFSCPQTRYPIGTEIVRSVFSVAASTTSQHIRHSITLLLTSDRPRSTTVYLRVKAMLMRWYHQQWHTESHCWPLRDLDQQRRISATSHTSRGGTIGVGIPKRLVDH
jgi:DNA-directed RNA polymerase II subunit RPB7